MAVPGGLGIKRSDNKRSMSFRLYSIYICGTDGSIDPHAVLAALRRCLDGTICVEEQESNTKLDLDYTRTCIISSDEIVVVLPYWSNSNLQEYKTFLLLKVFNISAAAMDSDTRELLYRVLYKVL